MQLTNVFLFSMPGGMEIVLILVVVLLLFGARKIPELARGLGRGIREFKDATREVKNSIEESVKEEEERKTTTTNHSNNSEKQTH